MSPVKKVQSTVHYYYHYYYYYYYCYYYCPRPSPPAPPPAAARGPRRRWGSSLSHQPSYPANSFRHVESMVFGTFVELILMGCE